MIPPWMRIPVVQRGYEALLARRERTERGRLRLDGMASRHFPGFSPTRRHSRRTAVHSLHTVAVYCHEFTDDAGRVERLVEKIVHVDPLDRFLPLTYFYDHVAASTPFRPWAPVCLEKECGRFAARFILEFVQGVNARPMTDFRTVLGAIRAFQADAPAFSPEGGGARLRYFARHPSRQFRGFFPEYVHALSSRQLFGTDPRQARARALQGNLERLRGLCAEWPVALVHLDPLCRNILFRESRPVFIDWDEACYAPPGFGGGAWLQTALFATKAEWWPKVFAGWLRFAEREVPGDEREAWLLSGWYAMVCYGLHRLFKRALNREGMKQLPESPVLQRFLAVIAPLFQPDLPLTTDALLEVATMWSCDRTGNRV